MLWEIKDFALTSVHTNLQPYFYRKKVITTFETLSRQFRHRVFFFHNTCFSTSTVCDLVSMCVIAAPLFFWFVHLWPIIFVICDSLCSPIDVCGSRQIFSSPTSLNRRCVAPRTPRKVNDGSIYPNFIFWSVKTFKTLVMWLTCIKKNLLINIHYS